MRLRHALISNVEKLEAVESAILPADALSKRYGGPILKRRASALKAVAGELRMRIHHSVPNTQQMIENRLMAAYASLEGARYGDAELVQLGLAMIQHWGIIRMALETFKQGKDNETDCDAKIKQG